MKKSSVFFLCFIICIRFFAQSGSDVKAEFPFAVKPRVGYGFIIPHRTGMRQLIKGHIPAYEINFEKKTLGNKEWQQLYNFPSWGVSVYYSDLQNKEQLGNVTAVYPYFNFSFFRRERIRLNYRVGWGLCYVSKSFDRLNNYKNIAVGSKINAFINLLTEAEMKLSEKVSANVGVSFTHFSNAAYKTPNLGLNIPAVNLGLVHKFGNKSSFTENNKTEKTLTSNVLFIASAGVKELQPPGGPKYLSYSLSAFWAKKVNTKGALHPGIELFYNTSLIERLSNDSVRASNFSAFQSGISCNYSFDMGKISIITGMGVYLHTKYKLEGMFYHRIGSRFYVSENLFINITLKSHFTKADFLEIGLGYAMNSKNKNAQNRKNE